MIDPGSLPAILADVAGAGLLAVGALGVAFPSPLAHSFGVPLRDKSAVVFVRATGVRDVALGAVLLAASLRGAGDVLLVAVIAGLAISLADFANAFFGGDRVLHRQHVVHVGGAAYFAAILALLLHALT
ncbi:MAG TPA: DUF4267 domain-containing protein [Candidatus Baltobacteraceae bacterium]|nr:DUF4267 domain-containing protein [Candidatus Baltobacteraceae bacterium]